MLLKWGYQCVFREFQLHFTLTGKISKFHADEFISFLEKPIELLITDRFHVTVLVLAGQDKTVLFHELIRKKVQGLTCIASVSVIKNFSFRFGKCLY